MRAPPGLCRDDNMLGGGTALTRIVMGTNPSGPHGVRVCNPHRARGQNPTGRTERVQGLRTTRALSLGAKDLVEGKQGDLGSWQGTSDMAS